MNPAYSQARFRAELPHGSLPESFAVITACNPEGKCLPDAENIALTSSFEARLRELGLDHFPVTGYDAGSPHAEPGFGIVCDLATAMSLGDSLAQEAIFRVHRGVVTLIPLRNGGTPIPVADRRLECHLPLGPWSARTDAPSDRPIFHFRGPFALLEAPANAFLCSTRCPAAKVSEAYDWARAQCDKGGTVISGFHSPVERDVLAILARRGARILWAPARDLPVILPKELKTAQAEDRLLILSPFAYTKRSRPTRESSSQRNRFILHYSTDHYVPHIAEGSSLAADLASLNI